MRWFRGIVAVTGFFYTINGLALAFAPQWFLLNVGRFPPFNRHYMGDLSAFVLPIGLGLLLAARRPGAHRLFLGVVALGNGLHAVNHLYDAAGQDMAHWLTDTLPVVFLALLFVAFWWLARADIAVPAPAPRMANGG